MAALPYSVEWVTVTDEYASATEVSHWHLELRERVERKRSILFHLWWCNHIYIYGMEND